MTSIDNQLLENAKEYCSQKAGLSLIESPILGHGTDGKVWSTSAETAIKAFHRQENYAGELSCYQRLKANGVSELDDLAVPELLGYSSKLLVIEMTKVQKPYVLDFGKVSLDRPPLWWDDMQARQDHFERIEDDWDFDQDRINRVHLIMGILRKYGIYYADPRPSNIDFGSNE